MQKPHKISEPLNILCYYEIAEELAENDSNKTKMKAARDSRMAPVTTAALVDLQLQREQYKG